MLSHDNLKNLLNYLQFTEENNQIFVKNFSQNSFLKVDFAKKELIYPEMHGLIINERQTCNFSASENFVVFECVHRLLEKGYKPEHIELEPKWKLGHGASGGRADILVKTQDNKPLLIIECKTADKEFKKAWKETQKDGGQLLSYAQQIQETQFLCLYASDFEVKTQTLIITHHIISHKDNQDVLKEDKNLKSFDKAKDLKERFEVWKNTYKLESTQNGIFEENMQAYQIGKDKYTLDFDTKALVSIDKKGLYHAFRTILRSYNVSRRENAFDVLVNLFLCKIIDEKENKNDLKFRWKGIAYDNYYDLVDRLQELYQVGMKRFLDDEILYVSNEQIDKAFWTIKSNRNATKDRIKEIFRELKFFKGLDFEFVKVHNKKGFDKNIKILIKMVEMWQNVRLSNQNENQFFGDMFEFFLDNGVKQTEGQFFTPIPICKFVIASLPLAQKIKDKPEPLKVIDYACGAGHFLTEYATAIKNIVKQYKQTDVKEYYQNIFGIDKDDRLAKIAKVAAFMYGKDEIQTIDEDALATHPKIKEQSFDVLVANPPFAVTGFLTTLMDLDEKETTKFELFNPENTNTNNIQCFFLERAKQLLAPDAVTGIIVPTSILSTGDDMHTKTREILLKYFDFISIVELGGGTFGKTGTNTVVLFLKRKAEKPEQAEHFWDRTLEYFEFPKHEIECNGGVYQDLNVLKQYCNHIEIPFEVYTHFLLLDTNNFDFEPLEKYDIFKEYKNAFDKKSEIINLKKNNSFLKKDKKEQQTELNKRFIEYVQEIEKQKFYFFMLAYHNPQKVLIVKSPQDNKEQKKFLGYEWTGARGNEGIIYNGGDTVYDIITPMFNPKDENDQTKISYLIQQNFQGVGLDLDFLDLPSLEDLASLVQYTPLTHLLDFSRTTFDKSISLSIKIKKILFNVESKYPLKRVESLLLDTEKISSKIPNKEVLKNGKYPVISQEKENIISGYTNIEKPISDLPLIVFGDHSFTFKFIDFPFLQGADGTQLLKIDVSQMLPKCFYYFMQMVILNDAKYERNFKYLKELKIPLPPLDIQEKIVAECESIDQATQHAKNEIENAKKEIESRFEELSNNVTKKCRLNDKDLFDIFIGKRVLSTEIKPDGIPVYSANVFKPFGYIDKDLIKDFSQNSILWGIDGDWMVNVMPANTAFYPTDHCGVIRIKSKELNYKYVAWILEKAGIEMRFSRNFRASIDRVESIYISVPPLSIQKQLVGEIEILENKILENEKVVLQSAQAKQLVMARYL